MEFHTPSNPSPETMDWQTPHTAESRNMSSTPQASQPEYSYLPVLCLTCLTLCPHLNSYILQEKSLAGFPKEQQEKSCNILTNSESVLKKMNK